MQGCVELKIVRIAQTVLISLIPRVVPAVSGLYSSPPPAGQLCAAATSLLAAGVDARSGGALLRHQNPCTLPAQLWLRAALDTSSTSAPRYVRRLFLVKGRGFGVVVVVVFFVFQRRCFFGTRVPVPPPPSPKSGGTLSVAQRDSAVSDYKPCAEEPPAQSASLWGRNSTQDSGGTREHRGISADRGVLPSPAF